jgi:hypothetical protein
MKIRHATTAFVVASFALAASAVEIAQSAPAPGGGLQVLDFKPGFDDLMTMMVQPRHIKLYVAGQQKNWELAAFELGELRASLRRIGQTIPRYRTYPVDSSVASIFAPKIQAMDAAIKSADSAAFATAYADLTAACNTCHQAMEHPFLVIKVPSPSAAAAFIDQEFVAGAAAK